MAPCGGQEPGVARILPAARVPTRASPPSARAVCAETGRSGDFWLKGKKRVTLEDVSREAGVSTSAVSMILGMRADMSFSDETKRKVRKAAKMLGYEAPARYRRGVLKNRKTIIIVCPNNSNFYYASVTQSIQAAAKRYGYNDIVFNTFHDAERERHMLEMAQSIGVSGIVYTMIPQCLLEIERLNNSIPIVAVCDKVEGLDVDTVELNNLKAGRLMGSHLIELGHRNVAFISTTLNDTEASHVKRMMGLHEVFKRYCANFTFKVFTVDVNSEQELTDVNIEYTVGKKLTEDIINSGERFTAIVSVNDSIAYGSLDVLKSAGYTIPGDISVCGFNNVFPSKFNNIALTTIEHHMIKKGKIAFHILHNRIIGGNDPSKRMRVEYTPQLIVRETTGPAPSIHQKRRFLAPVAADR